MCSLFVAAVPTHIHTLQAFNEISQNLSVRSALKFALSSSSGTLLTSHVAAPSEVRCSNVAPSHLEVSKIHGQGLM